MLAIGWASFLAASIATMVLFAFVDPTPLVAVLAPTETLPGRTAIYSVGFFFFWIVCVLSATLTATLLTPPENAGSRR